LLPELYNGHHGHDHESGHAVTTLSIIMLAGFFTQLGLDTISLGVEHGHAHHVRGRLPIGIIVGLCLHALVEASALGNPETHYDPASRRLLLWSIVLHNFPVSIALLGMLLQSGMRRAGWISVMILFAAMAPIGMTIAANTGLEHYSRELTAFVIGIFMHISTTILFESSETHRFNLSKLAAIIVGTALGFASLLLH
jgi:zinc and cadmium transporter